MSPQVLETPKLSSQHLAALHEGSCLVIRVPGFFPTELGERIASQMGASELYGRYANAPAIGRVGQAFFESLASEEHRASYEKNSLRWIQDMRSACEPYLTPIDKLRLSLDESWPGGAKLGCLNGRKMFAGLARVFGQGAVAEPHQDVLSWDAPDAAESAELVAQFAANIYLKMPEEGGELCVWPCSLSREDYERHRNPGSYGIDAAALDCEAVRITPRAGELILFPSTCVHSVEAPRSGERVTWSCFIGDRGPDRSLMIWS
jgi:hypothetical protein